MSAYQRRARQRERAWRRHLCHQVWQRANARGRDRNVARARFTTPRVRRWEQDQLDRMRRGIHRGMRRR